MWIMAGNGKRYSREFRERVVGDDLVISAVDLGLWCERV